MTLRLSSIRNRSLLFAIAIAGLLIAGGCSSIHEARMEWREGYAHRMRKSQYQLEPVMADPEPDEAATARAWDRTNYLYPNGAVSAYPTYKINYEDRWDWVSNDYVYSLMEPAAVITQAIMILPRMIVERPWEDVVYNGVHYPPTMTAAPPLPQ